MPSGLPKLVIAARRSCGRERERCCQEFCRALMYVSNSVADLWVTKKLLCRVQMNHCRQSCRVCGVGLLCLGDLLAGVHTVEVA